MPNFRKALLKKDIAMFFYILIPLAIVAVAIILILSEPYSANATTTLQDQTSIPTKQSGTIEYKYDEGTQRIMKDDNGKKTYYVNDMYEEDSDGSVRKYIHVNGMKVATTESKKGTTTGATTFHHSDHLGGSNASTNENGNLTEVNDYFPYGSTRIEEKAQDYKNNYLYTGKELDRTSGLYYYGARYYDPSIGRFTSVDPVLGDLENPQTLNKYSYVTNNPMKYVDPTGMWGVAPGLGGASHQAITNMAINSANVKISTADRARLTYAASLWSDAGVYAESKLPFFGKKLAIELGLIETKQSYQHSTSTEAGMSAVLIKAQMMKAAKKWYISGSIWQFGRLLHMVQDSYCPGHVVRDENGNIKAFLDADSQSLSYHLENDNYLDENNEIKPEAKDAGWASKKLIEYYYNNAGWEEVESYIDKEVLKGVNESTKTGEAYYNDN